MMTERNFNVPETIFKEGFPDNPIANKSFVTISLSGFQFEYHPLCFGIIENIKYAKYANPLAAADTTPKIVKGKDF